MNHRELTSEVEIVRSKIKSQLRASFRELANGKASLKMAQELFIGDDYITHVQEHGLVRYEGDTQTSCHVWSELDTETLLWALQMLEQKQVDYADTTDDELTDIALARLASGGKRYSLDEVKQELKL